MPSPLQIVIIFQTPELNYDSTLVLNPDDAVNYKSTHQQLVLSGMYLADMAYAIQNNKPKEAIRALHPIKILGEKTGMNERFNRLNLIERFENNLENKDSMMTILLDASISFEMYLDDKSLMHEISILFGGIWLEGAYVSSQIASFKNEVALNKLLVYQYPTLINLVKVMNSVPNENPYIKSMVKQFTELESMMAKMKTIKKFMKKKTDIPLTTTELKLVEEKIRIIRSKVISQK